MAKRKPRSRAEERQKQNEVRGVILIAAGMFLAACQYFDAIGIVGEAVSGALFGIFGLFAYALPFALAAVGVWFIASAPKDIIGRIPLLLLGILFALTLIHVFAGRIAANVPFVTYVIDAYTLGSMKLKGGGALGALVCYPLLLLVGEPGAYIFLIAGILVVVLLISRLSLKEAGQQVKTHVQAGLREANEKRQARKQLYIETLDKEKSKLTEKKPVNKLADVSFLPTEGPIKMSDKPSEHIRKRDPDEEVPWDEIPGEPEIYYYDDPGNSAANESVNEIVTEPVEFTPVIQPRRGAIAPDLNVLRLDRGSAGLIADSNMSESGTEEQKERPPYVAPSFSLLNPPRATYGRASMEAPTEKAKLLVDTLESFHVQARVVNISVGPVVTRFELAPAPGVRVNKITALSDDIALALAAPRVRIEAPIPGKSAVGIEVPNKDTAMVVLRDIVESNEFTEAASPITLALGKDIAGKIIVADLAKMPHLLIAGATGSGKSVCINDIIISLVYKCTPDELQLILVDPKVVELSAFSVLPHLKVPVVTDPKKAAGAISGGVREMTERYKKFAQLGARDLSRYNELQKDPKDRLPKLVIIIDELADLMMVAPDTVEDSICRIAQLGRAAGIHLIVATQRPSADVITGLIKANIPSRIAFSVASAIDSRIILDSSGAEKLLGRGDMLFQPNGSGKPLRAQAAYVSDEEVERIVRHFETQELAPEFDEGLIEEMETGRSEGAQGNGKQEDELLGEAVRIVLDSGQASISMIQRRLRVGYARAARLVDIMEQRGYVSGFDGSKPRRLLITRSQYESIFGDNSGGPEDE